jgi:hypothetical protein
LPRDSHCCAPARPPRDAAWLAARAAPRLRVAARRLTRVGPLFCAVLQVSALSAGCAEDTAGWTTGPNSSIPHAKGLASSEYGMSRKPLHLSCDERPLRKGMRPNGPKSAESTVGGEQQPLKGRDEAREKDTNQQLHWLRTPAQLPAS